jgi:hypothetical protein
VLEINAVLSKRLAYFSDLSHNMALCNLYCSNCNLTSLDISNNTSLGLVFPDHYPCILDIGDMPSLEKVCVWILPFPLEDFQICSEGSPDFYFTIDCNK